MNILDMVMNAGSGSVLNDLSQKTGLSQDDAGSAATALLGQLMNRGKAGLQDSTRSQGLQDMLQKGGFDQYLDNPGSFLQSNDMSNIGNDVLGYMTGSKTESRQLASQVSEQTGIDPSILKSMLPMLAPLVMGALSKNTQNSGGSDIGSMLGNLLDQDGDGSVVDDLAGLAGKFFR